MEQYLPVLTLGVLGILFVLLSIFASKLFAPQRNTLAKSAPYECGITDTIDAPERFPVKFYLVAMLFIMFDIEIIFLYPWAVANDRALASFGLVAMLDLRRHLLPVVRVRAGYGWAQLGPWPQTCRLRSPVARAKQAPAPCSKVGLEGRREPYGAPASWREKAPSTDGSI